MGRTDRLSLFQVQRLRYVINRLQEEVVSAEMYHQRPNVFQVFEA